MNFLASRTKFSHIVLIRSVSAVRPPIRTRSSLIELAVEVSAAGSLWEESFGSCWPAELGVGSIVKL